MTCKGFVKAICRSGLGGWLFAVLLLASGCEVGPRYAPAKLPAPPAYKELPPDWTTAQPSDAIARGKWWEIYQDAQLNGLEEQINVSNQNLKAAQAQYIQARALVRQNRADFRRSRLASPRLAITNRKIGRSSASRPPHSPTSLCPSARRMRPISGAEFDGRSKPAAPKLRPAPRIWRACA
jgi:hypothetical protein